MTRDWDRTDEEAEREHNALCHAFHTTGIAIKAMRGGVYRTTRGAGNGAAARPASKGFDTEISHLPPIAE